LKSGDILLLENHLTRENNMLVGENKSGSGPQRIYSVISHNPDTPNVNHTAFPISVTFKKFLVEKQIGPAGGMSPWWI
jgi:hypothetical protein